MTMNQMWLALVLVVLHIVQLALVIELSFSNMMKMICPSVLFHLEKNSHVLSVLSVMRNWQTKFCFQVSWKETFTQSTHIYARNQLDILKGLYLSSTPD
jgi:hypothetical protein